MIARIAVNGQRQFDGNLATFSLGHVAGATTQQIGHQRTDVDVVSIVVFSVLAAIDLVGHACPLGIIAGPLECPWHTTHTAIALDVAHASSESDGISCHHTAVATLVADGDTIELAVTGIEVEGT